jgi:GNAT superfamily N-acetyltransferase
VSLDPAEVMRAAAEWVWVPPEAQEVRTEEFRLVAYPRHFADPTQVTSIHSARPADQLVDDVLVAAATLGRPAPTFLGISDTTRPPELERTLLRRGATLHETLAVLALDLTNGLPDLDVPSDLELTEVWDVDGMAAVDRLDVAVFGDSPAGVQQLAASLARVHAGVEEPRVLAWRDGVAVGTAGHVFAGGVLRLWGACVLPEARHTGVYRALLEHRLRAGIDVGCRMALVKGRVETSAPVLRRAGFAEFGQERSYRLAAG